jgi:hypothetical protein
MPMVEADEADGSGVPAPRPVLALLARQIVIAPCGGRPAPRPAQNCCSCYARRWFDTSYAWFATLRAWFATLPAWFATLHTVLPEAVPLNRQEALLAPRRWRTHVRFRMFRIT